MDRLKLIRFAIAVVRDGVTLTAGVFLALYLPITHQFQPWYIPLITGLLGVPWVARGGSE